MKVILIDWNAYGNNYIYETMISRGYEILKFPYDPHLKSVDRDSQSCALSSALGFFNPDYIFSYHYFPDISNACEKSRIPYISWIYDSPAFDLYSPTILNSVNHVFVFDRGVYEEFQINGIPTVYYLPLGVYTKAGSSQYGEYSCDLSFIGSLYTEPKHRLYDRFKCIPPYARGYLDACIEAQKHLYGANILESLITPEIESEMQKAYPTNPNSNNIMTPTRIYSQFVLSRQVTARERKEILNRLGQKNLLSKSSHTTGENGNRHANCHSHGILLYTHDSSVSIPGIQNMGPVEYGSDMYNIFASSRINLNISLRSILTGIPLRALDIMNSGGFLLSNYQEELCEYFIPGEDFDYYENYEDLMNKIEYYLTHEKERCEMAVSAQQKIKSAHSLDLRLDVMEETILSKST